MDSSKPPVRETVCSRCSRWMLVRAWPSTMFTAVCGYCRWEACSVHHLAPPVRDIVMRDLAKDYQQQGAFIHMWIAQEQLKQADREAAVDAAIEEEDSEPF